MPLFSHVTTKGPLTIQAPFLHSAKSDPVAADWFPVTLASGTGYGHGGRPSIIIPDLSLCHQ